MISIQDFDCDIADFHADGKYRVFDNSVSGSSYIEDGVIVASSIFSIGWMKAVGDFKLKPIKVKL